MNLQTINKVLPATNRFEKWKYLKGNGFRFFKTGSTKISQRYYFLTDSEEKSMLRLMYK